MPNGGLQVVNPSAEVYSLILTQLSNETVTPDYDFADQSLLGDIFNGRWVALPYIYNALRPNRFVHAPIWRDENIKNCHYLLGPKPWEQKAGGDLLLAGLGKDGTAPWWWEINGERLKREKEAGIDDDFSK